MYITHQGKPSGKKTPAQLASGELSSHIFKLANTYTMGTK